MLKSQPFFRISLFMSVIVFFQLSCALQTKNTEKDLSKKVPISSSTVQKIHETTPAPTELPKLLQQNQLGTLANKRHSPRTLVSFHRFLSNARKRLKPINILHLGDSHTAGDRFSGRLRELFQKEFGSAGRGMLPVGQVFPYFYPTNVKISQSKGWKVSNSYKASRSPPYGLSGFRIKSSNPHHFITLKMVDNTHFDEVALEFLRHQQSGTLQIEIDNFEPIRLKTRAVTQYVEIKKIPVPKGGGQRIKISPKGDGPIELLSWAFKNNDFGVIYHSHGIVGATINIMNRWNRTVVSEELQLLKPALIILAYGTNEGFHNHLKRNKYRQDFKARLASLQQKAPKATIVIAGPPDGNRLPRYCQRRKNVGCSPLTSYEIRNYKTLLAQKDQQLCRWHPPPQLEVVRHIQRKIANQQGYFFWDWSTVMGGACGIHAWTKKKLAHRDHVHLSKQGYYKSAEALFREIMPYSENNIF